MEAIAGFVVGYILGTRHGREGLQRLLESWDAVSRSEEFRGFLNGAVSLAGAALQQGLARTRGGGFAQGVAEVVVERLRAALAGRSGLRVVA
jgi:hypothetical protein